VTFATMNVFGANLNGIAKNDSRSGRDHYVNHAVMVMSEKTSPPGSRAGWAAGRTERSSGVPHRRGVGGDRRPAGTSQRPRHHVSAASTLGWRSDPKAQLDADSTTRRAARGQPAVR